MSQELEKILDKILSHKNIGKGERNFLGRNHALQLLEELQSSNREELKGEGEKAPIKTAEEILAIADEFAENEGYPQSDKECFETTYWAQHNIAANSFIAGYKFKSQEKEGDTK